MEELKKNLNRSLSNFHIMTYYINYQTFIMENEIWEIIFEAYQLNVKLMHIRPYFTSDDIVDEFCNDDTYNAVDGVALNMPIFTANTSFMPSTLEES